MSNGHCKLQSLADIEVEFLYSPDCDTYNLIREAFFGDQPVLLSSLTSRVSMYVSQFQIANPASCDELRVQAVLSVTPSLPKEHAALDAKSVTRRAGDILHRAVEAFVVASEMRGDPATQSKASKIMESSKGIIEAAVALRKEAWEASRES